MKHDDCTDAFETSTQVRPAYKEEWTVLNGIVFQIYMLNEFFC